MYKRSKLSDHTVAKCMRKSSLPYKVLNSDERPQSEQEPIRCGDVFTVSGDVVATMKARSEALAPEEDQFTIGEALEAAALRGGDKPVEQSDAAAIQAAEIRATRSDVVTPGGVAAIAESAASRNDRTPHEEEKTRPSDVVEDATTKLLRDRAVRREDAAEIMDAELRNNPNLAMHRGGVASGGVGSSMTAAARLNQSR